MLDINNVAPYASSFSYIENNIALAVVNSGLPQGALDILEPVNFNLTALTFAQFGMLRAILASSPLGKICAIDVENQQVTPITGLPLVNGYERIFMKKVGDEVYIPISAENAYYKYNPSTGVAEKAFDVVGGTVNSVNTTIYDLSE